MEKIAGNYWSPAVICSPACANMLFIANYYFLSVKFSKEMHFFCFNPLSASVALT